MQTKLFEVRDRSTFIPCLGILLEANCEKEKYLLRQAGFALDREYILFHPLTKNEINYDIYEWSTGGRTIAHAHEYVIKNWHKLESGQVIDVEFILGETKEPKQSERME